MTLILNVSQIIISLIIIGLVLIQDRSSDMGGIFGGGGEGGGFYQARRGLEKIIFASTIVAVILFTGLALAHFLV
jgi:protein translocase SecG subunit